MNEMYIVIKWLILNFTGLALMFPFLRHIDNLNPSEAEK